MNRDEHEAGVLPRGSEPLPEPTDDPRVRAELRSLRAAERSYSPPVTERIERREGHRPGPGDIRGYRMRRLLALADTLAVLSATGICALLDGWIGFTTSPPHAWAVAPFAVFAWLVVAGLDGMFYVDDRRIDNSTSEEIFRVTRVVGLWIWLVFAMHAVATFPGAPSVTGALALGAVAIPAILVFRDLARWGARTRDWFTQRAVLVGSEPDRERVRRTLVRHPEYGLEIVGEIELRLAAPHAVASGDEPDGISNFESVVALVVQREADRVILASAYAALDERTGALRQLAERGLKVDLVPTDSDAFRADAELHRIEGLPLLTLPSTTQPRSAGMAKRAIDLVSATVALALLSPFFALAAAAIKLGSKGPVLFRQRRVGRDGEPIEIFKFRTMIANADELKHEVDDLNRREDGMFKIPEDPRITGVGRFLRKYSLDELPQLLNVVRGEMSLVGPRPLIQAEADLIDERYAARFNVRPGITGPWQVLGRSDIPFDDMVKLDYTYVTNWSIGDDVKLMARTVSTMIAGRGAY